MKLDMFEQLLSQGIPTITMATIFIFYLIRKDKDNSAAQKEERESFTRSLDRFNTTINNHLDHSLSCQKDDTKIKVALAKNIAELTGCIQEMRKEVGKEANRNNKGR
jgi:hypothetical protein